MTLSETDLHKMLFSIYYFPENWWKERHTLPTDKNETTFTSVL